MAVNKVVDMDWVREALRPLATNYVLGYITNLKQFDTELKVQIDKVINKIASQVVDSNEENIKRESKKEVVEWIKENGLFSPMEADTKFQAKLKEWGLSNGSKG